MNADAYNKLPVRLYLPGVILLYIPFRTNPKHNPSATDVGYLSPTKSPFLQEYANQSANPDHSTKYLLRFEEHINYRICSEKALRSAIRQIHVQIREK